MEETSHTTNLSIQTRFIGGHLSFVRFSLVSVLYAEFFVLSGLSSSFSFAFSGDVKKKGAFNATAAGGMTVLHLCEDN